MIFSQFIEKCNNEADCINLFIKIYYNNELHCTICRNIGSISLKKNTYKNFQCNRCNKSFSIFKDTTFCGSHVDFRKWLYIFYLLTSRPKCATTKQLIIEIAITHKTAWRLLSQLKKILKAKDTKLIATLIEINDKILNNYLTVA